MIDFTLKKGIIVQERTITDVYICDCETTRRKPGAEGTTTYIGAYARSPAYVYKDVECSKSTYPILITTLYLITDNSFY